MPDAPDQPALPTEPLDPGAATAPGRAVKGGAERIVDGGQPVALVVDDDPIAATMLSEVLKVHGWRTIVATDGIGALGSIEGIVIDLLVTDQQMPGMTGLDLADRIRARHAAVPVIVTSGSDDVAALVTGPRTTFVRKPFSGADLMARVLALVLSL